MKTLDLSHPPQNKFILSWLVSFFVLLAISIVKYVCSGSSHFRKHCANSSLSFSSINMNLLHTCTCCNEKKYQSRLSLQVLALTVKIRLELVLMAEAVIKLR